MQQKMISQKALRAHKKPKDETKSDQRDAVAAFIRSTTTADVFSWSLLILCDGRSVFSVHQILDRYSSVLPRYDLSVLVLSRNCT